MLQPCCGLSLAAPQLPPEDLPYLLPLSRAAHLPIPPLFTLSPAPASTLCCPLMPLMALSRWPGGMA